MKKLLNILGLIFDVTALWIFTILMILAIIPMAAGVSVIFNAVFALIWLGLVIMCSYESIKMAKRL
jgi:hypothetical protein